MCSSEALREFITDRLTAAATQIFTVFQQTIDQYEEEIDRQRRLLQTHTHDNLCQLETSFSLKQEGPEPPQEREPLLLKQEPVDDENLQPPPASENSASAPTFGVCYNVHRLLDQRWKPTVLLHDLQQQRVNQDEEGHAQVQKDQKEREQLLINQEPDSVLVADSELIISNNYFLAQDIKQEPVSQEETLSDQEQQEPTQIQFSTFQEQEQPLPKHESDTVPLTLNEKQSEPCQSEADSEPVLHNQDDPPEDHQHEHQESGPVKHKEQRSNNRHKRDTKTKSFQRKRSSVGQQCDAPFSCNICGKRFTQSLTLKRHTSYHKLKKDYSCDTCGTCFHTPSSLKQHMRIHTGEKPHRCVKCGRCFIRKNDRNRHMETHTRQIRYPCEICGRCFFKNNHLQCHMRSHRGVKPRSCKICGKFFTKNTHKGPHTGEKQLSYETCGKCFIKQGI